MALDDRSPRRSVQATHAVAVVCSLAVVATLLLWFPNPLEHPRPSEPTPETVARIVPIPISSLIERATHAPLPVTGGEVVRLPRTTTLAPANVCPQIRFTALGLAWRQAGGGNVSADVAVGGSAQTTGKASTLRDQTTDGPDPGSAEFHAGQRATDILWVSDARCATLRLTLPAGASISNVRAVFINSSGTAFGGRPVEGAGTGGSSGGNALAPAPGGPFAPAAAEAGVGPPAIISRVGWGANEKLRNCDPYYSGDGVHMAFIHHTDNLNTYSKAQSDDLVRAIYWYHTQALGWCDIAYNFLVDKYGQVFEGRAGGVAQAVIGAATRGFNTGSVSVSAIGNYETARPSSAMIGAIERLLAWRLDVAHVDPTGTVRMLSRSGSTGDKYPDGTWHRFKTISGHRDAGFTACPGTYLYAELGAIRTAVYHRGLPKIFDPRATTTDFVTTQGSVTWTARGSTSLKWELQVLDANGAVARTWTASGWTFSRSWDGRASDGTAVPPGAYTIVLRGTRASQRARAASFTLMIEPIPAPSPSPSPSESPGPTPSPTDSPSPSPSDSPSPSPSPTESLPPSPSPS